MSKIAIFPLPEAGHILPTFHLAKTLRRAGHEVTYVGVEDCRAIVEAEGFAYAVICAEALPEGSLARQRERASKERLSIRATAFEHTWLAIAGRALLAGHEDARLAAIGADLFLVDRVWQDPMLIVNRLGVPTLLYTAILWAHPTLNNALLFDRDVPPPSLFVTPRGLSSWRRRVEWPVHTAREGMFWAAREHAHFRTREDGKRGSLIGNATRIATLGRRRKILERNFLRAPGALRTLILCPAELDFPRSRVHPNAEYCGPSIDLSRRELDVEVPTRDSGRPLVYATLGSQSHRAARNTDFLRLIIDAARVGRWRLVVSIGNAISPSVFGSLPEGVTVASRVPQLKVLAEADAAIVHGGLGTIKECIWFGVPMLVLANRVHDQPGNAARVEFHGLGIARRKNRTSPSDMRDLVTRLLHESPFRARLAAWSKIFRAAQDEERELRHVEAALARRNVGG